jgi:hypothetical protein
LPKQIKNLVPPLNSYLKKKREQNRGKAKRKVFPSELVTDRHPCKNGWRVQSHMDPAEGGGGEAIIMCKKKQKTPDENKYK